VPEAEVIDVRFERRRSARVPLSFRCWITSSSCALYASICNINRQGLAVAGLTPFQPGDEITIRIEGLGRGLELVARSRVVWSRGRETPGEMGMGAEFLEITSGAHFLDRLLGRLDEATASGGSRK
jgi:hypothetical protein